LDGVLEWAECSHRAATPIWEEKKPNSAGV
jgi:hypothetical protein